METLVSSELGHRLKLLRQRLGVTGAQMAEEADIPLPVIKKIEQGYTANPGFYVAEKLIVRYGVNANWLITGRGEIFVESPELEKQLIEAKAEVREKESLIQMLQRAMVSLKKTKRGAQQPDVTPVFGLFSPNLVTSVTTRIYGTPVNG
ncbi:helix-turn-helix domain-containing protein [Fibrella forsythiae]|uniref:Helix-turn-helix domain-containing protein n=1 Tax=Fibrella forsythiae TaxID=2817061 RepID=A0ABS3JAG0_9BACT|nr:helix-turn-helix transcriptional regulator [Fibrella forsythiae]MBO0946974.1 helix-turn-helix domain-containing protein [Fibrella forsythiae]